MNITIGRGNNRMTAEVVSGKFGKGTPQRVACERTAEDIKNYLAARDPNFRKRRPIPKEGKRVATIGKTAVAL